MSTGNTQDRQGSDTRTAAYSHTDRRQFIGTALAAAVTTATLPVSRLWAAAGSSDGVSGEVAAVTLSGQGITLSPSDIKDFRASLRGHLLLASDEGYDQARRLWNGAFDRHPALIARCAGAADVVQAVNFA